MLETTKSPVALATVSIVVPRLSLIKVTVAPGMTPPCTSLTVPATVPVVACAAAGGDPANPSTTAAMAATTRLLPGANTENMAPPEKTCAAERVATVELAVRTITHVLRPCLFTPTHQDTPPRHLHGVIVGTSSLPNEAG